MRELPNEQRDVLPPTAKHQNLIHGEIVEHTDGFRLGESWIVSRDDHGDLNTHVVKDGWIRHREWGDPLAFHPDPARDQKIGADDNLSVSDAADDTGGRLEDSACDSQE